MGVIVVSTEKAWKEQLQRAKSAKTPVPHLYPLSIPDLYSLISFRCCIGFVGIISDYEYRFNFSSILLSEVFN